jgi:hypothetical protein
MVRCQLCDKKIAHRPGEASEILTKHYREVHWEPAGDGDKWTP